MEHEMKVKAALFKSEYGDIHLVKDEFSNIYSDYVQISEFQDVEFKPLTESKIIENQLNALDAMEEKLRDEFRKKFDNIQNKKAQLLALPNLESAQ